jgi:polyisoprenoid-binding protein YceI
MKRHWKKIVGAVVVVIALIVGVSWFYAKVLNKAPAKLAPDDLIAALDATVPPDSGADPAASTSSQPSSRPASDVTGLWRAVSTSLVRYRVNESINGFDTTAVGGTNQITGTITIDGNRVRGAGFTVDMTTFHSDESKRDSQFAGRVMDVQKFPTATFNITTPILMGAIPVEGKTLDTKATGDLTLLGTTKSVTFDVLAVRKNGKIGIMGNIPVVFADYGIPNPSFATVSTADHGELEFIVVLARP